VLQHFGRVLLEGRGVEVRGDADLQRFGIVPGSVAGAAGVARVPPM
jgi:hypothetical protein